MTALEPCPFCRDTRAYIAGAGTTSPYGWCQKCGATGPRAPTREEASTAWNRRASEWQPTATAPRTPGALIVVRTTTTATYRWHSYRKALARAVGKPGGWEVETNWGWTAA